MGTLTGTYSCTDGTGGPFTMSEIEVTRFAFAARLSTSVPGCARQGHIGGVRSTAYANAS